MTYSKSSVVPDWRDPDRYPSVDGTSDKVWRWEFLRRRPDYRMAWATTYLRYQEDQSIRADFVFLDDDDPVAEQLGTKIIYNPCKPLDTFEWPGCFFYDRPANADVAGNYSHLGLTHVASKYRCPIFFDVSRPLAPQLEEARRTLEHVQAKVIGRALNTRKLRKNLWPLYLRALDARDAKATYAKIGKIFWPNKWLDGSPSEKTESHVRDICKAAKKLRDNFPL